MKRVNSIIRISVLVFIAVCLMSSALAEFSWQVDVDALKAVEKADTFGVKVTKKTVSSGYETHNYMDKNDDLLTFEITNSSEYDISSLLLCFVAYDENNMKCEYQLATGYTIYVGEQPRYRSIGLFTYNTAIARGETEKIAIQCSREDFKGVRAIVYQVVTTDGQVLVNPVGDEWYELALGSPTHILD